MSEEVKTWVTHLKCPFCSTIIVEACDHSIQPDNISDERWEEITCSEEGDDDANGHCEHLAFWSDWAFAGSRTEEQWRPQINEIAKVIYLEEEPAAEDVENIDIEDTIASRLIDVESEIAKQELLELMSRAVPNVDMEIVVQYVEKFAGIKGGGPTYMMIFLKKQT